MPPGNKDHVRAGGRGSDERDSFRDGRSARPTDIYIALMGVTGAGKSTFISHCVDKPVKIGHRLEACTQAVEVYPFDYNRSTTVYLIDTPGFDDTYRSDTDVLKEVASWLTISFTHNIQLNGIIYLHRISDIRMQGSARKNLLMFKKLCGPEALKNVVLATTFWDKVDASVGERREKELVERDEFWGWMKSKGSRVMRHANDRDSTIKLIGSFIKRPSKVTLELQSQMVIEGKTLDQTDAGLQVIEEIEKARERFKRDLADTREQISEALKQKDEETARFMAQFKGEYEAALERLEANHRNLQVSMEKLHEEKTAQFQAVEKQNQQLLAAFSKFQPELHPKPKAKPTRTNSLPKDNVLAGMLKSKPTSKEWPAVVALHYRRYYLAGPGGFEHVLADMPSKFSIKKQDRPFCVALGSGGSWVASILLGSNRPYLRSEGLDVHYPKLLETLLNPGTKGVLNYVSLGPNGTYYARFENGTDSCLPPPVETEVKQLREAKQDVAILALGVEGTYVLSTTEGRCIWNLKGNYRSLSQWLESRGDDPLRALDIDCSGPDRYIILTKGNKFHFNHHTELKEKLHKWGTANFGIK